MITITDLSKRYGAQLLFEGVNLRLDPGKRYGIVGANGAGKSTLLRILIGAEYADSGEINIPSKLEIGTLNQDHFAFEDVTLVNVTMRRPNALPTSRRSSPITTVTWPKPRSARCSRGWVSRSRSTIRP